MKDFENYKSELDNLYLEEQSSKENYEFYIETYDLSSEDKEVLQEMYFSKKDLQDPKTIKKIEDILNRTRYQNVAAIASTIAFLVPIAISIVINPLLVPGGILAGIALVVAIITRLYNWVETAPQKAFEKNYEKYKKQVKELKEKTEKQLAKKENSKFASKYKEIITNCDKVLKAIDEREKKIAKLEEKETYDFVKSVYEQLVKFLEQPYNCGWEGYRKLENIVILAEKLKISEAQFMNRMKKVKYKNYTLENAIIHFYGADYKNKNIDVKEVIDNEDFDTNNINLKIKVIEICSNDDNIDYIGQDGNLYSIQTDNTLYKLSMYKEYGDGGSVDFVGLEEYLIEVDKELGYYILSEPPKGLERKKLPL